MGGSLLKYNTASLSVPLIYLKVGQYYHNSKSQISNIFILKFLYVRFLWSIYMVIECPNRMVWNYLRVYTILNRSLSVSSIMYLGMG